MDAADRAGAFQVGDGAGEAQGAGPAAGGERARLGGLEAEIADRVARYLKAELKRAGMTYQQLADCLKGHGLPDETEHSIKAKLKRGTFPATFFLATLAALGREHVGLAEI